MENIYKKLNKAIDYLEEHLFEEVSYGEIAKILEMNENYSKIIFELLTNYTPNEYVRLRRLSEAVFLLRSQKIVDVAVICGYDSREGFSRAFKKFHGFSPSEKGAYKFLNRLELNENVFNKPLLELSLTTLPRLSLYGVSYTIFSVKDIEGVILKFKKRYNPDGKIYGIIENRGEKLRYTLATESNFGKDFEKITINKNNFIQLKNPYFDYKISSSRYLILPDIEIFEGENHYLLFNSPLSFLHSI